MSSKDKKQYNAADVLKKVNKSYDSDLDKLKLASDLPDDYFKTKLSSTGSVYLDYKLGGVVKGALNLIVGKESSGKSSLALCMAKPIQDSKKYVVIFDAESSVSESYLERFGITKEYLIHIKKRNLEEVLDLAQEFSKADDVGMIIFDSIPVFTATAVEEKSANDNHMGVEARRWTTRFAVIESNCINRSIPIVALTFYTYDLKVKFGDPRVIKRGEWQKLAAQLFIELSKGDLLYNNQGNVVGHELKVKIKKSKVKAYDPKEQIIVNFYYDKGFDNDADSVKIFIDEGIINKSGSWFSFNDDKGEEVKIQGEDNVVAYMTENPKVLNMYKDTIGI